MVLETKVALSNPLLFVRRDAIERTSYEVPLPDPVGIAPREGLVCIEPAEALWTSVRGRPLGCTELLREPREYVDSASFPLPPKLVRGVVDDRRVARRIREVMAVCIDEPCERLERIECVPFETLKLESPCGTDD